MIGVTVSGLWWDFRIIPSKTKPNYYSLHLQFSRLHGHLSDCIIHHQHCYRANLKQKTQPRKSENEQTEKILVVTSTTISSFNSETLVFPFESNWFHRSRKYRHIEWQMTLPLPLLFSVVGYATGSTCHLLEKDGYSYHSSLLYTKLKILVQLACMCYFRCIAFHPRVTPEDNFWYSTLVWPKSTGYLTLFAIRGVECTPPARHN